MTWDGLAQLRGKVVLADGAFNPLHLGHLAYLRWAKSCSLAPLLVSIASNQDIIDKGRLPLLNAGARAAVVDALDVTHGVHLKDRPMTEVLEQLRPVCYVKGADWNGTLPADQIDACARLGIPIYYANTPLQSSTAKLKDWSARNDARHLARLEELVQSQQPASDPWQPVTDYSFEARRVIEGQHPQLIADVFQPRCVLDVGCGPGHLVRLLCDLGVTAIGIDRDAYDVGHPQTSHDIADLVICREVLEHLTIRQIRQAVANLCKLSSRFVYVTTRFAQQPDHLLSVDTSDDLDPTHITMLNQNFLRTLFVLEGAKRRADLEARMDWQHKGRALVYQVSK